MPCTPTPYSSCAPVGYPTLTPPEPAPPGLSPVAATPFTLATPATPPPTPQIAPVYAAGDCIVTPAPYSCPIIAAGVGNPLCVGVCIPPVTCAYGPCRPVGEMPYTIPYYKAPLLRHTPGYTNPNTGPCYHPCTMLCYPYIVVSVAYVSTYGAEGYADYSGICNTGI